MSNSKLNRVCELAIPPPALAAPLSAEVVRGWIVDGQWHFSLRMGDQGAVPPGMELELWGSLLHELALHLAVMYHKRDGLDVMETVRELTEIFTSAMQQTQPR